MSVIICTCPRCESVNLRFRGKLSLNDADRENIYDFECVTCEKMFTMKEVVYWYEREYQKQKLS